MAHVLLVRRLPGPVCPILLRPHSNWASLYGLCSFFRSWPCAWMKSKGPMSEWLPPWDLGALLLCIKSRKETSEYHDHSKKKPFTMHIPQSLCQNENLHSEETICREKKKERLYCNKDRCLRDLILIVGRTHTHLWKQVFTDDSSLN